MKNDNERWESYRSTSNLPLGISVRQEMALVCSGNDHQTAVRAEMSYSLSFLHFFPLFLAIGDHNLL